MFFSYLSSNMELRLGCLQQKDNFPIACSYSATEVLLPICGSSYSYPVTVIVSGLLTTTHTLFGPHTFEMNPAPLL